jgi:hypothetical protein
MTRTTSRFRGLIVLTFSVTRDTCIKVCTQPVKLVCVCVCDRTCTHTYTITLLLFDSLFLFILSFTSFVSISLMVWYNTKHTHTHTYTHTHTHTQGGGYICGHYLQGTRPHPTSSFHEKTEELVHNRVKRLTGQVTVSVIHNI